MKVSVIMPVERLGGYAERAIASVLKQVTAFPFELIVVSAAPLPGAAQNQVKNVVENNRNPATRRNRAVSESAGEILAFIDDDATAHPLWLKSAVDYFDRFPAVLALGGPDPAPSDSTPSELVSETLLATPLIGSGIAAHENRPGIFPIKRPSDIALVNLFVRREAFTGFDESVGYIGEDTALIAGLMRKGSVVYHDGVIVYHRRRAFPGAYLRQRWRYRVKTGLSGINDSRIVAFLVAGTVTLFLPPLWILYFVVTFALAARFTRLPKSFWPLLPFAFALHHLTYYFGILWGSIRRFVTPLKKS
ncbi:MAG TPA: glycosyltransferase [Thermoanaerobaculia bacterium]|nr:glycosyltransferase [Thermoanaerobaculia bacterium]